MIRISSEKCKVYIRPTAASETAVTIAIAKMGTEPICLRRCNRNRQCERLHRLQCLVCIGVYDAIHAKRQQSNVIVTVDWVLDPIDHQASKK